MKIKIKNYVRNFLLKIFRLILNMIPRTFILNNANSKKTDFTTNFSPTIYLQEKYEAALISIDLYNSILNITMKINILVESLENRMAAPSKKADNS